MADTFYVTLELKNIRMEGLLFSFLGKYEQNNIPWFKWWSLTMDFKVQTRSALFKKFYFSPTVCQHVVVSFTHKFEFANTSLPKLVWRVKAALLVLIKISFISTYMQEVRDNDAKICNIQEHLQITGFIIWTSVFYQKLKTLVFSIFSLREIWKTLRTKGPGCARTLCFPPFALLLFLVCSSQWRLLDSLLTFQMTYPFS